MDLYTLPKKKWCALTCLCAYGQYKHSLHKYLSLLAVQSTVNLVDIAKVPRNSFPPDGGIPANQDTSNQY